MTESQESCTHDDLDHGMCIDCGMDCMDALVASAEYACEGDR